MAVLHLLSDASLTKTCCIPLNFALKDSWGSVATVGNGMACLGSMLAAHLPQNSSTAIRAAPLSKARMTPLAFSLTTNSLLQRG